MSQFPIFLRSFFIFLIFPTFIKEILSRSLYTFPFWPGFPLRASSHSLWVSGFPSRGRYPELLQIGLHPGNPRRQIWTRSLQTPAVFQLRTVCHLSPGWPQKRWSAHSHVYAQRWHHGNVRFQPPVEPCSPKGPSESSRGKPAMLPRDTSPSHPPQRFSGRTLLWGGLAGVHQLLENRSCEHDCPTGTGHRPGLPLGIHGGEEKRHHHRRFLPPGRQELPSKTSEVKPWQLRLGEPVLFLRQVSQ